MSICFPGPDSNAIRATPGRIREIPGSAIAAERTKRPDWYRHGIRGLSNALSVDYADSPASRSSHFLTRVGPKWVSLLFLF